MCLKSYPQNVPRATTENWFHSFLGVEIGWNEAKIH